jgi:phage-related protein
MELFIWTTPNAKLKEKPRVKTAQFGDGYGQDSADGLNALLQQWSLKFEDIYPHEGLAIRAFLVARGGTEKFQFRTQLGEVINVKCREWDTEPAKKGRLTITATFEQVP